MIIGSDFYLKAYGDIKTYTLHPRNGKGILMKQIIVQFIGGLVIGMLMLGCSGSSETSRQSQNAANPNRDGQFVTKRDTVDVKVVSASKIDTQMVAVRDTIPAQEKTDTSKIKSRIFTIQLGAFDSEANACRWEEQAKDILDMPTYIEFDKRNKHNQYRVTIGTFSTRESAIEVMKSLKSKYSAFYKDAYVAESLRSQ